MKASLSDVPGSICQVAVQVPQVKALWISVLVISLKTYDRLETALHGYVTCRVSFVFGTRDLTTQSIAFISVAF